MNINKIICGDSLEVLKTLPDESVNCCITSPPYWGLRDYGHDGQVGLEKTPEEYVAKMVELFREVRRVLKDDGTLWLNLGDTYSAHKDCKSISDSLRVGGKSELANVIEKGQSHSHNSRMLKEQGFKNKDLIGIPWLVAFALRSDGWYLRQDIIWAKPNPMPESVTDRCTKAHEYIFLMSKSAKYYFDGEAIKEPTISNRPDMKTKGMRTGLAYLQQTAVANNSMKNISDKGQAVNTFHKNKAQGNGDILYNNRNKRSVWTITTKPFKEAHFATFPEDLIRPCILAGCPKGGIVLDPFSGAGTTALVAKKEGRNFIGIELNPKYVEMSENRINSIMF